MDWKEQYSVGIPELDHDHKQLVQCLNAIANVASMDAMHAALARFTSSIQAHFSTEERLMRSLRYPHYAAHTKEHRQFLAEARAIESGIQGVPVPREALELLEQSLKRHFTGDEKAFGVFALSRTPRKAEQP